MLSLLESLFRLGLDQKIMGAAVDLVIGVGYFSSQAG
jgi:hypothetical protein